ncbi:S8 family serine peptidase [Pirellulimonas nuda]|nr:S8 family serine peptidase [Pirellulimonas nuda]
MSAASLLPNDPYLLDYQWHIVNTGQEIGDRTLQDIFGTPGEDANVLPAWLGGGYTGRGVVIAIVDNGIQLNHPDLAANISQFLGAGIDANGDLVGIDIDPLIGNVVLFDPATGTVALDPNTGLPYTNAGRGTAVAGIAGAVGNNGEGIAGIAYNSTLVPIRVFGFDPEGAPSDEVIRDAIRYGIVGDPTTGAAPIDIYIHTWRGGDNDRLTSGPNDVPGSNQPTDVLEALRDSVLYGRNGLGAIHVIESGNGANPNPAGDIGINGVWDFGGYDGYVNSRYTIGVTGVDHDGFYNNFDGTFTSYPEAGAGVLVAGQTGSGPLPIIGEPEVGSGIWTTDLVASIDDPNRFDLEGYNLPADPFTGLEFDGDNFLDFAYTSRFRGTEASASVVGGVIALMLEAEPNLSYRDIQEILVRSSRQTAAFDGPSQGGEAIGPLKNLWITNRNELFHVPEFVATTYAIGDLFFDYYEDTPDPPPPGLVTEGLFANGAGVLFHPLMNPGGGFLGGGEADPDLYANGAGYTVSQGRGVLDSEIGFGHGVIDAGLAVKLAEQWLQGSVNQSRGTQLNEKTFTTFDLPPFANALNAAVVAGENAPAPLGGLPDLIVPGVTGSGDNQAFYDEYYQRVVQGVDADGAPMGQPTGPFTPAPNPIRTGSQFTEFSVPSPNTQQVEWVELQIEIGGAGAQNIENLRVTLISPDGVHSELNHYFDARTSFDPNDVPQFEFGSANLRGEPDLDIDPDGGNFVFTFSSNRHWGERSDDKLSYDPATGMPYVQRGFVAGNDLFPGTGVTVFSDTPTTRGWRVQIENFGDTNLALVASELTWHGGDRSLADRTFTVNGQQYGLYDAAVTEDQDGDTKITLGDTFRIQGFVGQDQRVDHDLNPATPARQDGLFSYDRWLQTYADSNDGLIKPDGRYDRLGEVERLLDQSFGESQPGANNGVRPENFLENVSVEVYLQVTGTDGNTDEILVDRFLTGDDGNYYFDVPLLRTASDIGNLANADIVDYRYVVRLAGDAATNAMNPGDDLLDAAGAVIGQAPTTPADFLDKYRSEWVISEDWFNVWNRTRLVEVMDTELLPIEGVNPFGSFHQEFQFVDSTGALVVPPPLFAGDFAVFDPKIHYDIQYDPLTEAPVSFVDFGGLGQTYRDHVRGINFLVRAEAPTATFEGNVYSDVMANGVLDVPQDTALEGIRIYVDMNGNGFRDGAEPFAESDATGAYAITDVPLPSGSFSFFNLAVDPASLPSGWTVTNPVGGSIAIPVVNGVDPLPQDFLIAPPLTDPSVVGTVSGVVYNDLNGNGLRDNGEPGLAGFKVFVEVGAPNGVADPGEPFAISAANGSYTIQGVGAGQQVVRAEPLAPFAQTDPANNGSRLVNVPRAGSIGGTLFGFRAPELLGTASGIVFNDANGDGVRGGSEVGQSGVVVFVDVDSNQQFDPATEPSATTDANGQFTFTNLPVGLVDLRVALGASLIQTAPSQGGAFTVDVQSGSPVTGVQFGVADALAFSRDFGDLGLGYPTLLSENGAWHVVVSGYYLGAGVTAETDGKLPPLEDDDDGVTLLGADDRLTPGTVERFHVTGKGNGAVLNVWIDFNADRVFDASEHVIVNLDPPSSSSLDLFDITIDVAIPASARTTPLGAIFRWGPEQLGPTGGAFIGEVETYLYNTSIPIVPLALSMGDYDGSGWVDQGDLAMWRSSFGTQGDLSADGNGDGYVDLADYTVWRDHYGMQVPAVAATQDEPLGDPELLYYASFGDGGWTVSAPAASLAAPATGAAAAFFLVEEDDAPQATALQELAASPADDDQRDLALELLAAPADGNSSDSDLPQLEDDSDEEASTDAWALAFEELLLA